MGTSVEDRMRRYGFKTYEEASMYADKNYNSGSYRIIETNSGTFAIDKEE